MKFRIYNLWKDTSIKVFYLRFFQIHYDTEYRFDNMVTITILNFQFSLYINK